jgi:hypothetical protein
MTKKILAIILAALMVASLAACTGGEGNETDTTDGKINITTEGTTANKTEETTEADTDTETGANVETGAPTVGDPKDYEYTTEKNGTVYVNNPGSAVTLRSADYVAKGSVAHGTELQRIGISNDADNYWSKVLYQEKEYYVATKFLTTIKDADEGFVEVSKTVKINEKTGSMNVRNIPSMEGAVICHVSCEKDVTVIAENTTTGWYKIEFVNNENKTVTGYIASNKEYFVEDKSETGAKTTDAATETATETDGETSTEA